MRPLERKLLKFSAFALLLLIVIAALLPFTACGCKVASRAASCIVNVRQQATGMALYAGDHDGRFTPHEAWMDGVAPYVKAESVFHDIDVPRGAYGYAFDRALSQAKAPKRPESAPMLYDSTDLRRNASDLVASLPEPGRHRGRNVVAYADGHAKALSRGRRL